MKIFLDTNILIYLLINRGEFTDSALQVMEVSVNR